MPRWARGKKDAVKRHKYGAVSTVVDGVRFASKAEAQRYLELKVLVKVGTIRDLRLQPRYPLSVRGVKLGEYRGDFQYAERVDGQWFAVCEDTKGFRTPLYRWKRKHMLAEHGIEVRET